MNIYEKFSQIRLSNNEKTIVDLIVSDPHGFEMMNLDEICKRCFVSKSTIYRLCDKLDLNGLSDLKMAAIRDTENYAKTKGEFDFNFPYQKGDSNYKIAGNLKEDYEKTILSTLNVIDFKQLKLVVDLAENCECIDIYTTAGNVFFAQNFQFQMMEIGRKVNVASEPFIMGLMAGASNKNHLSIVISFGGRGYGIEDMCKILKQNGSKIVLICSKEANDLMKYADYMLFMAKNEDHFQKISSFSTRLSLLYILDMIYASLFEKDYKRNTERKLGIYKQMTGQ